MAQPFPGPSQPGTPPFGAGGPPPPSGPGSQPGQSQPGGAFPGGAFPGAPYQSGPYPGVPYQTGPYPGAPFPGAGFPGAGFPGMGYDPYAPYGYDMYGRPYSQKSKVVAGVLQLVLGNFGAGRFYTGHIGIALAQLFTCGGLFLWALIDGIMLLVGDPTDSDGRPLRG